MINLFLFQQSYGFGNRILMWEAWYNFLSKQKEDFRIKVCSQQYDTDYFDYPKTDIECCGLEWKELNKRLPFRLRRCRCGKVVNKNVIILSTFDKKVCSGDYLAFDGMEFDDTYQQHKRHIPNIKIRNNELFQQISDRLQNTIGVHIRRGDTVDGPGYKGYGTNCTKLEHFMKKMDSYGSSQEFYVSTDGTYEEVKKIYDNYNVITSEHFGYKPRYKKMRWFGEDRHEFPKFSEIDLVDIIALRTCSKLIPSHSTWSDVCKVWGKYNGR